MGKFFDDIPPFLVPWLAEQEMFWVATAPLGGDGHVNVSPKGVRGCFHYVSPTKVWYQDLSGSGTSLLRSPSLPLPDPASVAAPRNASSCHLSLKMGFGATYNMAEIGYTGNETISHLREPGNSRITVLFSAFQGPPRIARLFGTGKCLISSLNRMLTLVRAGTVHEFGTPEYDALIPPHERKPGSRSAIVIDVHKVGTSCGYAVPLYAFQAHRTKLLAFFARREQAGPHALREYWALKNATSMDGLVGLESALACERVPESVFDEAREGRRAAVGKGGAWERWAGEVKFMLGLVLGALLTVLYGRLEAGWVKSGKLQLLS
ncbi:hypothetical protein HWV62_16162 [Athelia sp. TMB]|nr:hypothetical protein HWV62_16162 [Athelia sp. TMB]